MLEEQGLVEKIEPYVHTVPHGDRSNVVIEPFLTDQWYVDAKTLAKPAIEAVKRGRTVFVPRNWRTPIFAGWRPFSLGASRANSGGVTRSQLGMVLTERSSLQKMRLGESTPRLRTMRRNTQNGMSAASIRN